MADIELVIKIPEELYEAYKGRPPMLGDAGMDMIAQSIAKGTPLPKGHGKLKDVDELKKHKYHDNDRFENAVAVAQIDWADTIVEADTQHTLDREDIELE